jgi:hypothetical protein
MVKKLNHPFRSGKLEDRNQNDETKSADRDYPLQVSERLFPGVVVQRVFSEEFAELTCRFEGTWEAMKR